MSRHVRCVVPAFVVALGGVLSGCAFGPKAIEKSHGQYAAVVQQVEEEQFLKNVVRLRYVEAPTDLELTSIAAQYEVSAGAEVRPFYGTESVSGPVFKSFSALLPFASVSGSNRPTFSLTPQNDGSVVRRFLTPISAETLVFLSQSGWPISSILRIWADALNGVPNYCAPNAHDRGRGTDSERFVRATELIQLAQNEAWVSVRMEDRTNEMSDPLPDAAVNGAAVTQAAKDGFEFRRKGADQWVLVKREKRMVLEVTPAGRKRPELAELTGLLHLVADNDRYELVVASGVPDPARNRPAPTTAFRLTPRSTAQALFYLANGVEVPAEHASSGLVRPGPEGTSPVEVTRDVFRVRSCPGHPHKPPASAYCSVWYRDHWFYIDDRDLETKSTLLLMLQLRRLDFQRQFVGNVPALTLPVGR